MMSNFSKVGRERLHAAMMRHVEAEAIAGYVAAVERRGELHVEASFPRDTPFRIASMTKPVTAVVTLMLLEECRLRMDDPIDAWIPELASRRVLPGVDAELDSTVPAARSITVRDLLTYRCGLGFGGEIMQKTPTPFLRQVRELGILGFGPPDPRNPLDRDEWLRRLGTLPLLHQPGAQWLYSTSAYILGALIERVTGCALGEVFRERIFAPLGMSRTGFFAAPADAARLPEVRYKGRVFEPGGTASAWAQAPVFADAGAGLVSTLDDFLAFARLLAGYGRTPDGVRLLARPTVEAMITDQLTPEQKARSGMYPEQFHATGWGLGLAVTTRRDTPWSVPGAYGWDGGFGTTWRNDPHESLIGICLTQTVGSPRGTPACQDFWQAAYAAIEL
jgi:CubicO group peptidase (beta-lactamase class C family)